MKDNTGNVTETKQIVIKRLYEVIKKSITNNEHSADIVLVNETIIMSDDYYTQIITFDNSNPFNVTVTECINGDISETFSGTLFELNERGF